MSRARDFESGLERDQASIDQAQLGRQQSLLRRRECSVTDGHSWLLMPSHTLRRSARPPHRSAPRNSLAYPRRRRPSCASSASRARRRIDAKLWGGQGGSRNAQARSVCGYREGLERSSAMARSSLSWAKGALGTAAPGKCGVVAMIGTPNDTEHWQGKGRQDQALIARQVVWCRAPRCSGDEEFSGRVREGGERLDQTRVGTLRPTPLPMR